MDFRQWMTRPALEAHYQEAHPGIVKAVSRSSKRRICFNCWNMWKKKDSRKLHLSPKCCVEDGCVFNHVLNLKYTRKMERYDNKRALDAGKAAKWNEKAAKWNRGQVVLDSGFKNFSQSIAKGLQG